MYQARNILDKIWDSHVVRAEPGRPDILAVDIMALHEVTSPQAFSSLEQRGLKAYGPERLYASLDHSIPTSDDGVIRDPQAFQQVETLRQNARQHGFPLFDIASGKQGVVHVTGPEQGLSQPGTTIVCGDSHTATHGAFGALAFGIGTTEIEHVLATGCLLQYRPKTMKVEFRGILPNAVSAKDAVLQLIVQIGTAGATGHLVEFCGETIATMSMEERMTVCNMSIECGARVGLIGPDETTFSYLEGRPFSPRGKQWREARSFAESLISDRGCRYDKEEVVDISTLQPLVTWGISPEQAVPVGGRIPRISDLPVERQESARSALAYHGFREGMRMSDVPIDWAFLGSCTNGRIEDLRLAARVLDGRRIHQRVTFYVVPGSEAVYAQAEREGLRAIFERAGAVFRRPGCSLCLAMNDDKVPAGKRCMSTSNRNFIGRQGNGSYTHLAAPATVAASALRGAISSAEEYLQ